jgi:hypothetical protein
VKTINDLAERITHLRDVSASVLGRRPEVASFLDDLETMITQNRWVNASDLMGLGDLAIFFGVGVSTVGNWRDRAERTGMPAPVAILANGPVWDGAEVVEWWKSWVPARGGHKVGSLPDA